jgi:cytochrome c-type biogenesis protein
LLTTLSLCVLPVLPFISVSSLKKAKLGPAALALGLLFSFVGVSLILSTSGLIFGITLSLVRKISGFFLLISGFLFLSQNLADGFANRLSSLTGKANNLTQNNSQYVLIGEFINGILLGIVWTPCSGPSLGAALGLAAQTGSTVKAAIILLSFGVGAVLPLLAFAYGARQLMGRIKTHGQTIQVIKKIFGALVVVFGLLIVFELDRQFESWILNLLPESWLVFITQF